MSGDGMLRPAGYPWCREDFPEGAMGLRLVRVVQPGDRLRHYEPIKFPRGRAALARFLNMNFVTRDDCERGYGSVDVMDEEGDSILAEFEVSSAATFQRLLRKLNCRVESTDGDPASSKEVGNA